MGAREWEYMEGVEELRFAPPGWDMWRACTFPQRHSCAKHGVHGDWLQFMWSARAGWSDLYCLRCFVDWLSRGIASGGIVTVPGSLEDQAAGGGGTGPTTPAPTLAFTASGMSITAGQSVTLTWLTTDATSVIGGGGLSGAEALNGSLVVTPTETTTYTLTASGPGGTKTQSVVVNVDAVALPLPVVTLTVAPSTIVGSGVATLQWSSTNAATVVASDGWSGALPTSGSKSTGTLSATTTFTVTATNATGSDSKSATVTVTPAVVTPPPPLFSSQVTLVAGAGGANNEMGFFITPGPIGSVSPANLPSGGSATGQKIQAFDSQTGYDLMLMVTYASGTTQSNQFDSVSVVDDSGATRVFTTATQANLVFSSGAPYSEWWWAGSNPVMRTAGKHYVFTFTKQS